MLADIEAEHLLLVSEPGPLVELGVGDRDALVEPLPRVTGGVGVAAVAAEQAHDPGVTLASPGEREVDDLLVHMQESLTRMSEGVEGPCFDERLDRAFVEALLADALAEAKDLGDRPAVLPGGDDVLDEPLADIAHRRHPEPDRAVPYGEVALGLVHVGHQHRDADLPA